MWSPDNFIFLGIAVSFFAYFVISKICDTVLRYLEIRAYIKLSQYPLIIARENDEEDEAEDEKINWRDEINNP